MGLPVVRAAAAEDVRHLERRSHRWLQKYSGAGGWGGTGAGCGSRSKGLVVAHTVLVAAGTSPNTVLAREDAAHFKLDGKYFIACDEEGRPKHQRGVSSEPGIYFLGLPWQSRRGSAFIWGVWHDAKYLADQITIQRNYITYHEAASRRG